MNVYVVVTEDRHTDPDIQIFSTVGAAAEYARSEAADLAGEPSDVEEEHLNPAVYLLYLRYSSEGDRVWVREVEVDAQLAGEEK